MPVNVSHKAAISNPFYLCGLMLVGVPRAWGGGETGPPAPFVSAVVYSTLVYRQHSTVAVFVSLNTGYYLLAGATLARSIFNAQWPLIKHSRMKSISERFHSFHLS